jgi:hypothetical protein
MSTLANLKKNSSVENLTKALEATQRNFNKKDENYWELQVDKAGNGYAVIRFLDAPAVDGSEALPFVHYFSHGFQGPGGWYIENSLTTFGDKDPVSEYNGVLWNSGIESNKEIARRQKRQLNYVSNILVVKDSNKPENEGKVFLFRYGKKIFDKCQEKLKPQFEDEVAFNPWNLWDGANFKLKARKGDGGFRSYDKSEFETQSPVAATDAEIEKIWKSEHSLKSVISPDRFKSYAQLKARLDKVLGVNVDDAQSATTAESTNVEDLPTNSSTDDEQGLSLFEKLANE